MDVRTRARGRAGPCLLGTADQHDELHTGPDILELLPAVLSLANGLNNKGKMYERNERHIKFVLSGCHGPERSCLQKSRPVS